MTQVPSAAGGERGIAVRVLKPERPRYPEGAPVVIHVAGGFEAGAAAGRPELVRHGFVELYFAFPGGGRGGARSGGTYDVRGPNCIRALADVIRFATGRTRDTRGRTLQDLVPGVKVLSKNCGLIGGSQGGNACGVVMAEHGREFPDLAFYASMESPVGEGMANVELGGHGDRLNPAYDPRTGRLDLSKLAYASDLEPAFAARRRPGRPLRGALFFDLNGDGRFAPDQDYPARALIADAGSGLKVWYSPRLLREAARRKLCGGRPPAHFPSVAESVEFWRWRDAAPSIPRAVRNCPRLAVIVYANERDHVQVAPDHPHILIQVEGFRRAGARFVRLNPDREYVRQVAPPGGRPPHEALAGMADNDAGVAWTRDNIRNGLEPARAPATLFVQAAVCELADRTWADNWQPNLDAVLRPYQPAPLPRPPGRRPRPGEGPIGAPPGFNPPPRDAAFAPPRPRAHGQGVKSLTVDAGREIGRLRSLLGVNRGPFDWPRRPGEKLISHVDSYRRFGIEFIRTHDFYGPTDWHVIFPRWEADPDDPACYDFASSDTRISAIVTNGFRCFYRLGTSWKGRRREPINDPPGTRRDAQDRVVHEADVNDFRKWARVCVQTARHYTAGWKDGFRYPIEYWEIWNEPDLAAQFWTGTPEQYYQLYEQAARALKAFNPRFKVGGPACTGGLRREYVEDFIRYCAERDVPLDFFSWHSYGGRDEFNPYDYRRAAERIRRALDQHGFRETENIQTEWNAGISRRLFSDTPAGAAFYASVLANLLDADVAHAFQYCGDSHPGLGLHEFRSNRPKICAFAFAAWKRLLATPVRVAAEGSDRRGYNVVAGRSADGRRVRVLISDFQSGHDGFRLRLRNLPWDDATPFHVQRRLLDGAHRLDVVETLAGRGRAFTLERAVPAPQVTLIELEAAAAWSSVLPRLISPRRARRIRSAFLGSTCWAAPSSAGLLRRSADLSRVHRSRPFNGITRETRVPSGALFSGFGFRDSDLFRAFGPSLLRISPPHCIRTLPRNRPVMATAQATLPRAPARKPSTAPRPARPASLKSRPPSSSNSIAPTNGPRISASGPKKRPTTPPTVAPSTPRHVAPSLRAPTRLAAKSSANESSMRAVITHNTVPLALAAPNQSLWTSAAASTSGGPGRAGTMLPATPTSITRSASSRPTHSPALTRSPPSGRAPSWPPGAAPAAFPGNRPATAPRIRAVRRWRDG